MAPPPSTADDPRGEPAVPGTFAPVKEYQTPSGGHHRGVVAAINRGEREVPTVGGENVDAGPNGTGPASKAESRQPSFELDPRPRTVVVMRLDVHVTVIDVRGRRNEIPAAAAPFRRATQRRTSGRARPTGRSEGPRPTRRAARRPAREQRAGGLRAASRPAAPS